MFLFGRDFTHALRGANPVDASGDVRGLGRRNSESVVAGNLLLNGAQLGYLARAATLHLVVRGLVAHQGGANCGDSLAVSRHRVVDQLRVALENPAALLAIDVLLVLSEKPRPCLLPAFLEHLLAVLITDLICVNLVNDVFAGLLVLLQNTGRDDRLQSLDRELVQCEAALGSPSASRVLHFERPFLRKL